MAVSYKKLWKLLIDREMSRTDLQKATGISWATMTKLSKGKHVGVGILEKICTELSCDIGDIAEIVPELQ